MAVRSSNLARGAAGNPTINLGDRIASHCIESRIGATRPLLFFSLFVHCVIASLVLEVVGSFLFIFSKKGGGGQRRGTLARMSCMTVGFVESLVLFHEPHCRQSETAAGRQDFLFSGRFAPLPAWNGFSDLEVHSIVGGRCRGDTKSHHHHHLMDIKQLQSSTNLSC